MCGTAAEVTPLALGRRPRDRRRAGDAGELQKAYLDTVRGESERYAQWRELVPEHDAAPREHASRARSRSPAPWIDERDEELVLEVLRSGWLSLGPTGPRFEALLAGAVGAPHAAAVSSGTAGLHLCMRLAGDRAGRRGDHLALLVRRLGELRDLRGRDAGLRRHRSAHAQPRSGGGRGGDHRRARRRSSPSTSSATPASSTSCARSATRHGLALVEDACEALGARYKGRPLGSHGHPAVFAFYPNKQITTGEGGAVTTGSADEHELLVSLRNQGRLETSSWLQHGRLGFNYRLDDISAALGIGQLEKLDRILAARGAVAARYDELLAGVERRDCRSPTTTTTSARGSSTS